MVPLHCKRSVVDIQNKSAIKIEKWNKIVIEASKQCRRNLITKIEEALSFDGFIKTLCSYDLSLIACTGHSAKTLKSVLNTYPSIKTIACLIGPEGGFTSDEIEMAEKAGCIPISIGHSILKIETAAIAISSILLYAYSD